MSTALARAGLVALVLGVVTATAAVAQDGPPVLTVDHYVTHVSTAPTIDGQPVRLYVRERVLDQELANLPGAGRVVLFVHGSIFPSTPSFDLPLADYSWMVYLAEAGFDAFSMDMTGYGGSTRPPQLDDPCNASQELQQQYLIPNPLTQPCPPSYPFRATNYPSQWDDVGAVVDYLRELRHVDRVSLIGWSSGGARVAGYAALHPESVESLVLLAPSYNRSAPADPPAEILEPGFPLTLSSPLGLDAGKVSDREVACGNEYGQGTNEVLAATNANFDPVGASWGAGVVRAPTTGARGWNAQLAAKIEAPALLLSGEFDTTVAPQAVRDLYADIASTRKVFVELACSSHRAQHQTRYKIVQEGSLDWLLHESLDGMQTGMVRKGD